MKVDKELLRKEKLIYGDDFTPICLSWGLYLGIPITPKDVAMMMAQVKDTRVKFIQNKLNDLKDKTGFLVNNDLQELYKMYKTSLDENMQKKDSLFIYSNKF